MSNVAPNKKNDRLYQRTTHTAQKVKFSIKDFFRKCEQICSFLWIWSHLLKKSLMENFILCAVIQPYSSDQGVVEKLTLFYTWLKKNTTILTTLSSSAQHFDGIRHIILKTGSKMMIRFGLQSLSTGYISGFKSCRNYYHAQKHYLLSTISPLMKGSIKKGSPY